MHIFFFFISLVPPLLFSQVPEFMQQYSQRLGGTTDELARIVGHFEADSRRSGYEPQAAIGWTEKNPERLIRDQAARSKENIVRLERLRKQQEVFGRASIFARFISILTDADPELLEMTWQSYKPGFQISFDALLFALIGLLVPWASMIVLAAALGARRFRGVG